MCLWNKGKATHYCQNCKNYVCPTCIEQHISDQHISDHHKLLKVEDVQSMNSQEFVSLHLPLCDNHKEPLRFYCINCKIPICTSCTVVGHRECEGKHKPVEISEAFQQFQKTATELKEAVNQFTDKIKDSLEAVNQNNTKLEQCQETIMKDIDKLMQEVINTIKDKGNDVKDQVHKIYKRKKDVINMQMDELKTTISDANIKLTYLNQLLKSNEVVAMQSSDMVITALQDRIKEIPRTQPNDNGQIYFFENSYHISSLKQHDIGNVTEERAPDCLHLMTEEEEVIQGQTIKVKLINTGLIIDKNILKATWTQPSGNTCMIQHEETVYGNIFFTRKCKIPGVYKLNVSLDDEPIKYSPMAITVEKKGLKNTIKIHQDIVSDVVLSRDDCLLVACQTADIFKYKKSGNYIDKSTLPEGVKVNRMCKMTNGDIAFSDCGNKCITTINENGEVIKSIGEGELTDPQGIHVNESSNVTYVADSCVFMFDNVSGQMIRRISRMNTNDVTFTKGGNMTLLQNLGNFRSKILQHHALKLLDNKGNVLKLLVRSGIRDGRLLNSQGVVVDEDDNIIVSSQNKLQLFSSDGTFIKRIDNEGEINNSLGLCIISHHPRRVAVANNGHKTIQIYNY
ncbi:E3 ubiquitin-protein ligase TRIM71-like [Anneissia japonica]|uniref:E3 ubiquitin-protein ligase TRIM71-like n=1 Tax=Anneissia japonica TaxID=1529436 RepID=UPI001425B753|nr:E3 ubiquitin-protein ligase TRIM71-like [Anneissia japonica]